MPKTLRRLLTPRPRRIERDVMQLALDDGRSIDIQRVRDPRARRIRLSVDDRGARLTLPVRASLVSGERFVREHRDWLLRRCKERDFTLRGLVAELADRGVKVDYRSVWEFVHAEKLSFKKNRASQ